LLLQAVRIAETGGLLLVFVDVSEIRRLERVRTDFVANVSHELRTPITAIRGYAETLRAGALSDPGVAATMVEIIFRQSERLSRLVEDLLELSRLEGKELKLAEQPVSLQEVANRAADAVRPRAQSKGIRLEIRIPEELTALADERAVEQVLLNLLDNAVKYMPSGGEVSISARARDGRCEIEVRDSGIGIEAKYLPRLFERFYRVDKGRSREMGGTGLGLAIVKHLVAGMKGEVRVQSQPGVGSTFTVVLREAAPEAPRLAARF
jgi:two-component system phosphate regulon sensor histidine kinase PhoR